MPTVYVTTKFTLKGRNGSWAKLSPEDQVDAKAGLLSVVDFCCNEMSITLIDANNEASLMGVRRDNFGPDGAFKIDFDDATGAYSLEFDGVIKLPVSGQVAAALALLPKKEPTSIWIRYHNVAGMGMTLDSQPTSAPCLVAKSKPKDVSF
jgi:hypothetical protein